MFEHIGILGGGAIGSSLAADMHLAGHRVELIDQWPAHVEAVHAGRLRVTAPDGDRAAPVDALHLSDLAARMPVYDLVFLACKGYDTRWMATLVEPYLADDGVVVVTQNGMTNDLVADVVGRERTIGAVVELSAALFTPGLVERDTARAGTWFALGELDGGLTPRLEAARDVLSAAAVVDTTDNIEGAKWSKLVVNTATMGSFGILGLRNGPAARLPGMLEISMRLGRETVAVGDACGIRMEPILGLGADELAGDTDQVLDTLIRTLLEHIGEDSRTAPVHDHGKGRRSEMDFIHGEVVRRGREVGVPTPANQAVLDLDDRINRGELAMEPANLERLKHTLGLSEIGSVAGDPSHPDTVDEGPASAHRQQRA